MKKGLGCNRIIFPRLYNKYLDDIEICITSAFIIEPELWGCKQNDIFQLFCYSLFLDIQKGKYNHNGYIRLSIS